MPSVLITGATSGIGYALAQLAASSGWQVIACGRQVEVLKQLNALKNVQTRCFDTTDQAACQQALHDVKVDYVVLNAGVCEYVEVNDFSAELFARVWQANVQGYANCLACLLPNLSAGSKITFVDSLARLLPFPRSAAYGSSKAALHYMAKSLAVDLANRQIAVQTISPGFVKTPLTDKNDFAMPMLISVERAAEAIFTGIQSPRRSIYFPLRLAWLLRLINLLPESWQHRLALTLRKHG